MEKNVQLYNMLIASKCESWYEICAPTYCEFRISFSKDTLRLDLSHWVSSDNLPIISTSKGPTNNRNVLSEEFADNIWKLWFVCLQSTFTLCAFSLNYIIFYLV